MTKLKELLNQYNHQWYNQEMSRRYRFDTDKERMDFILKLNEINAEYFLYHLNGYCVEVFLKDEDRFS